MTGLSGLSVEFGERVKVNRAGGDQTSGRNREHLYGPWAANGKRVSAGRLCGYGSGSLPENQRHFPSEPLRLPVGKDLLALEFQPPFLGPESPNVAVRSAVELIHFPFAVDAAAFNPLTD